MEVKYNVSGERRKELVSAVSTQIGVAPVYKGAPTFAYVVWNYTIGRNGELTFDDRTDSDEVEALLERLDELGFEFEAPADADIPDDNGDGHTFSVELPLAGFSDEAFSNLEKLVDSKAGLIKKALGVTALPIEKTEDRIRFPWFPAASPEENDAYVKFIAALYAAAKEQKRVTAKERPVDNDKFAFRIFLVRLGFVGETYKAARKILLRNLTGNVSWKNGAPKRADEGRAADDE